MGSGRWPLYRPSRYCSGFVSLDANDIAAPPELLAFRISSYAQRKNIQVIIPVDLPTCILADELRPHLNIPLFPMPSAAALRRLHDKWTFSRFLAEHRVPQPRTRLLTRIDDVNAIDLPPPWIVKPRDGEGGLGVRRVEHAEELMRLVASEGELLAQESLPGKDIDLSFLADRGRMVAWTIQTPGGSHHRRVFQNEARVLAIGRTIAAACGYHGVAHIDMRTDERDGSIKVLEINPRFWNTLTHSLSMGVNFPDLGLAMVRGEAPPASFTAPQGAVATFAVTPWRLLNALVFARPPRRLGTETEGYWRQIGADPLPELLRCFIRFKSTAFARKLARFFTPAAPVAYNPAPSQDGAMDDPLAA
jgi:hypothetical protein